MASAAVVAPPVGAVVVAAASPLLAAPVAAASVAVTPVTSANRGCCILSNVNDATDTIFSVSVAVTM